MREVHIIRVTDDGADLQALHDQRYGDAYLGDVVRFIIPPGIVIGSNSACEPALRTGAWPSDSQRRRYWKPVKQRSRRALEKWIRWIEWWENNADCPAEYDDPVKIVEELKAAIDARVIAASCAQPQEQSQHPYEHDDMQESSRDDDERIKCFKGPYRPLRHLEQKVRQHTPSLRSLLQTLDQIPMLQQIQKEIARRQIPHEFRAFMDRVCIVYDIDPASVDLLEYWESLKDFDLGEIEAVVEKIERGG